MHKSDSKHEISARISNAATIPKYSIEFFSVLR